MGQVIGEIVFNGILRCGNERGGQIGLIFQIAKSIFKCFRHRSRIAVLHVPKGNRAVLAAVGIRYVENMAQPHMDFAVVKKGDAFCTSVYPPAQPVPQFNFRAGGRIRSLRID
ncbi:hypothetical protein [Ruminiclostridium cellobioparum]|uniref:hypothetical protein n=1 Tax=Ruminiclostridium cellobioparum TaxID=29355 RepID=UPI0028A5C243|nr:hypothetical protein [Ruminiclostridium cellobioparum]